MRKSTVAILALVALLAGYGASVRADGNVYTTGVSGTFWRTGAGAPSNSLGSNGDFYLNTSTGGIYKKASGSYSLVYTAGGGSSTCGSTSCTDLVPAADLTSKAGTSGFRWLEGNFGTVNATSIPGFVPTVTTLTAGTGLSGGGSLAANRTINIADTAVTPASYTYSSITVDQQGRLTAASSGAAPALIASSNTFTAANTVAVDDASNTSATPLLTLTHTTSGTAAAGIGAMCLFRTEDGAGNTQDTADITGALSVVTNASELGYIRMRAMNGAAGAAAMADGAYVWGSGRVGIGTSTTEPSALLHVSGSGSVPVFIGNITGLAGSYPVFGAYRAGAQKGYWGLNSSDEMVTAAGATQFRVSDSTGITTNSLLGINQATLPAAMIEVTPLSSFDLLKLGTVFKVTTAGNTTIAGALAHTGTTAGLYGATAAVQGAVGTTMVNSVTSGGTTGTVANYTDLTIYANDAATIRNNFYQLASKVNALEAKLKLLGAVKD
jgi:hypothetical protein